MKKEMISDEIAMKMSTEPQVTLRKQTQFTYPLHVVPRAGMERLLAHEVVVSFAHGE